jgi:hypothetical protein
LDKFSGTTNEAIPLGGSVLYVNGESVLEPLILVIEDEYLLQREVEKALTDGGFASEIVSSGEEALTLFTDGSNSYRALVTDVNLGELGGRSKRLGSREAAQGNRAHAACNLHDGCHGRTMGLTWRFE